MRIPRAVGLARAVVLAILAAPCAGAAGEAAYASGRFAKVELRFGWGLPMGFTKIFEYRF